jgi:phage N-6-adenine-methyltransferase
VTSVPAVADLEATVAQLAHDGDIAGLIRMEGRVVRFAELVERENTAGLAAAAFLRLRLDICRAGGALLANTEKKLGGRKVTARLAETLGVESDAAAHHLSSRWQRIAAISDDLFVEYRDTADEPGVAGALRLYATGRLDPLMSSRIAEWSTPNDLFGELDDEFGFGVDVCASTENAKTPVYFTREIDGLAQKWRGVCWMNPPYGKGIGAWMAKAFDARLHGATVVCLVPARTDTGWWWDHARLGEIRFLRGRLRFSDSDPAPFPSAVVVFEPGRSRRVVWWDR